MNLLKSKLRYSTPFSNAKATNEDESADFAHLTLKLVAMAMSLERARKKKIKSVNIIEYLLMVKK